MRSIVLLVLILGWTVVGSVRVEGDAIEVHGFLLGELAVRTSGERPIAGKGGDFVMQEGRLRLDLSGRTVSGKGSFLVKGDLFYDGITSEFDADLREAHAGVSAGPIDLRIGRQIVTWGVGDLLFIDDVFPKDWNSFFSGRPADYLKHGVDGFRMRYSSATIGIDFLAIPFFTPDSLPSAERFLFFSPFSALPNQPQQKPASKVSNTELALRAYRQIAGTDVSFYTYRGFWRSPALRLDNPVSPSSATRFYPRLSVYGVSGQRGFLNGVLSMELGYYDSGNDRGGNDPIIPNSQWRFLMGYQRQLWSDTTLGIQTYGEILKNYQVYRKTSPPGPPSQDRVRTVLTSRLTRFLRYQTWKLSLFAAYSPTDNDYFLRPELAYKLTENVSATFGANLFGGSDATTYFGQFDQSDNVFFNVRFDY